MKNYLWLAIAVLVIIVGIFLMTKRKDAEEIHERRIYAYLRRDYIMSEAESHLFRRLEQIAQDRYYIFPQVHLSSLLDNTVKGQNWKGALSAIQRKSVDFALVDKATLVTRYAVELDDSTHDKPDRQIRDSKVEQYLNSVGIPLVRLRNVQSMTDGDIDAEFIKARTGQAVATSN